MHEQITRGDLAELAANLPEGELKKWCDLACDGPSGQVVFVDAEMLSQCQKSAKSPNTKRAKKESNSEEVQGQPE